MCCQHAGADSVCAHGLPAVVVAEIVRSGFVEGHHYGSMVALDADGSVDWSVGDVDVADAAALVQQADPGARRWSSRARPRRASCWRWPAPRTPARRSTSRAYAGSWPSAGLDESALQTPPDYPLDDEAREALIRAGGAKAPIADELLGQARRDARPPAWSTAGTPTTYLDPDHPLQQAIADDVRRADRGAGRGTSRSTAAARRCSPTSLIGLARAFRDLAPGRPTGPERRVAEAIRAHPEYVSGTTRDELALLRAIPGAIGKAGAESCYAVAPARRSRRSRSRPTTAPRVPARC